VVVGEVGLAEASAKVPSTALSENFVPHVLDKHIAVKIFLPPCIWYFCRGLEGFRSGF
jgi:hypothetical protein